MTYYSTLNKEAQDIVSQLRSLTALDRLNLLELDVVFVELDKLGWQLAKKKAS